MGDTTSDHNGLDGFLLCIPRCCAGAVVFHSAGAGNGQCAVLIQFPSQAVAAGAVCEDFVLAAHGTLAVCIIGMGGGDDVFLTVIAAGTTSALDTLLGTGRRLGFNPLAHVMAQQFTVCEGIFTGRATGSAALVINCLFSTGSRGGLILIRHKVYKIVVAGGRSLSLAADGAGLRLATGGILPVMDAKTIYQLAIFQRTRLGLRCTEHLVLAQCDLNGMVLGIVALYPVEIIPVAQFKVRFPSAGIGGLLEGNLDGFAIFIYRHRGVTREAMRIQLQGDFCRNLATDALIVRTIGVSQCITFRQTALGATFGHRAGGILPIVLADGAQGSTIVAVFAERIRCAEDLLLFQKDLVVTLSCGMAAPAPNETIALALIVFCRPNAVRSVFQCDGVGGNIVHQHQNPVAGPAVCTHIVQLDLNDRLAGGTLLVLKIQCHFIGPFRVKICVFQLLIAVVEVDGIPLGLGSRVANMPQVVGIPEGISVNRRYGCGNLNIHQTGTVGKCVFLQLGYSGGNLDGFQTAAVAEHILTQHRYRIGNADIFQGAAFPECAVTDRSHVIRHLHTGQCRAFAECICTNGGHTGADHNAGNLVSIGRPRSIEIQICIVRHGAGAGNGQGTSLIQFPIHIDAAGAVCEELVLAAQGALAVCIVSMGNGDDVFLIVITTAAISALCTVFGTGGCIGFNPVAHVVTQLIHRGVRVVVSTVGAGVGGETVSGAGCRGYHLVVAMTRRGFDSLVTGGTDNPVRTCGVQLISGNPLAKGLQLMLGTGCNLDVALIITLRYAAILGILDVNYIARFQGQGQGLFRHFAGNGILVRVVYSNRQYVILSFAGNLVFQHHGAVIQNIDSVSRGGTDCLIGRCPPSVFQDEGILGIIGNGVGFHFFHRVLLHIVALGFFGDHLVAHIAAGAAEAGIAILFAGCRAFGILPVVFGICAGIMDKFCIRHIGSKVSPLLGGTAVVNVRHSLTIAKCILPNGLNTCRDHNFGSTRADGKGTGTNGDNTLRDFDFCQSPTFPQCLTGDGGHSTRDRDAGKLLTVQEGPVGNGFQPL